MGQSTKTIYSDIIERMKASGRLKNDSAVARALGVTPQALSNYKKRDHMPPHLVIKFASTYGFSVDWLLSGDGDVIKGGGPLGLDLGTGGYSLAREGSDNYGEDDAVITAEELIYAGKLLRILREADETATAAIKYSVDAFTNTLMKTLNSTPKDTTTDEPTKVPPKDIK